MDKCINIFVAPKNALGEFAFYGKVYNVSTEAALTKFLNAHPELEAYQVYARFAA